MARVVSNAALDLDQLGYATGRPKTVVETESFGTTLEAPFDASQGLRIEQRWSAHVLRPLQGSPTALFKLLRPTTDRLAMHADLPCDFRLAQPLAQ